EVLPFQNLPGSREATRAACGRTASGPEARLPDQGSFVQSEISIAPPEARPTRSKESASGTTSHALMQPGLSASIRKTGKIPPPVAPAWQRPPCPAFRSFSLLDARRDCHASLHRSMTHLGHDIHRSFWVA